MTRPDRKVDTLPYPPVPVTAPSTMPPPARPLAEVREENDSSLAETVRLRACKLPRVEGRYSYVSSDPPKKPR